MEDNYKLSTKTITLLFNESKKAATFSYSPYSKFRVGAALLCSDGQIYSSCNIENSSYGLTICAERSAIFKAISVGATSFVAIGIYSPDSKDYIYPCGACRQVLKEFAREATVICFNNEGEYKEFLLSSLLPNAF